MKVEAYEIIPAQRKSVRVEVDIPKVLKDVYWKAQKQKPKGAGYIGEDGHWYVFWFEDYHKREDVYQQGRKAEPWEIELKDAYETLLKRYREALV